jgi:hypothetical protein
MMQLIHSRKVDQLAYVLITLEEVFTIKGSNIFNQDKIAEQLTKLR